MTAFAVVGRQLTITGGDAVAAWCDALARQVPGAEFTPRYQRMVWSGDKLVRQWDGMWRPFACRSVGGQYIARGSRGFLTRALRALAPDKSTPVHSPPDVEAYLTTHATALRDYQQDALRAVLMEGWGRVALATNAGKGAIIALALRYAWEHGRRAAVVCDEVAVWDALCQEIAEWAPGVPLLRVGGGCKELPDLTQRARCVVVAMVPTLHRRLKTMATWAEWWRGFDMVLADEADKATAATWRYVLGQVNAPRWCCGFSGTFPHADTYHDLVLEAELGPIVARLKNIDLITRDISAHPTVVLAPFDTQPMLRPLQATAKWFRGLRGSVLRQYVFEQAVMNNTERHLFIQGLIRPGVPTAIIVNRIAHGEQLARHIPGAVFLDGDCSYAERRATLDAFHRGEHSIVIVTKILDRGTNRLGIAVDLLFVSGEGSARQTLQRIGRGLRRTDGKAFLRIVDIVDRGHVYLHEAVARRLEVYHAEEFDIDVLTPTPV